MRGRSLRSCSILCSDIWYLCGDAVSAGVLCRSASLSTGRTWICRPAR